MRRERRGAGEGPRRIADTGRLAAATGGVRASWGRPGWHGLRLAGGPAWVTTSSSRTAMAATTCLSERVQDGLDEVRQAVVPAPGAERLPGPDRPCRRTRVCGLRSPRRSKTRGTSSFLASPDAAASVWCGREVEHWRAKHGSEGLLVLLTDGEILWDEHANDFDWSVTTALGPAFAGAFEEEPFHVDMRWARSETQLDLTDGRFRDQVADLAAPVHGMAKDELASEDVRQHRRAVRQAIAAGIALVLLTIAAVATSVFAVQATAARRDASSTTPTCSERARVDRRPEKAADGQTRSRKKRLGQIEQATKRRAPERQRAEARTATSTVANGNAQASRTPTSTSPTSTSARRNTNLTRAAWRCGSRRCSPRPGSRRAAASS